MRDPAAPASTTSAPPEPLRAPLPPALMLRSKRPLAGVAIRVYVPLVLIVGALLFSLRGAPFWLVLGLALAVFALFPALVSALLRSIEREVLAATPKSAPALVDRLRNYRRVRLLAPFAWTAFQEGRLHMIRGDGRAAAKCLSEAARLGGASADPPPSLLSAQAHAHLIAEAPEPAREALAAVLKRQPLGPWDELHLGAALLLVGKVRAEEALQHIDAAQAVVGATPRVLAARALAEQRAGDSDSALGALKAAEAGLLAEPDRLGQILVDRARRLLRPAAKAQDKRARKRDARSGRREDERGRATTHKESPSVVVTPPASAVVASTPKEAVPAATPKEAVQAAPVKLEQVPSAVQVASATPGPEGAAAQPLPAPKPAAPAERAKGKRKTRREERRAARRAAKAERRAPQRTGSVVGRGSAPTRRTAAVSATAAPTRAAAGESVAPPAVAPKVEAVAVERTAKVEAQPVVVEQAPKAVAGGAAAKVEARAVVERTPKAEAVVERAAPRVEAVVEHAAPQAKVVERAAPRVDMATAVERAASRVEAALVAERSAASVPASPTAPSPTVRSPEPERKDSAVKAPAGTSLFGWLKEPAPQRAGWPAPPTLSAGGLPRPPAAPNVTASPPLVAPSVAAAAPVAPPPVAPPSVATSQGGGFSKAAPPPVAPPSLTSPLPVHLVPPVAVAPPLVAPAIAPAIPAAVSAADDAEWDSLLDTLGEDPGLPPNLTL